MSDYLSSSWDSLKRIPKELTANLADLAKRYGPGAAEMGAGMLPGAGLVQAQRDYNEGGQRLKEGDYWGAASNYGQGAFNQAFDVLPYTAAMPTLAIASKKGRSLVAGDQLPGPVPGMPDVTVPVPSIRAYHGSPHSFNKFDLSKIGTGEGAQAYGHGLYFAGNEDVARSYRDTLSNRDPSGYASAHLNAQNLVTRLNGDADHAAEVLREQIHAIGPDDANFQRLQDTLKFVEDGGYAKPLPEAGHMYEVDIQADPEHFLDWDKPLREQSEAVREAFRKGPGEPSWAGERDYYKRFPSDIDRFAHHTGSELYTRLAGDEFGQDMASGTLQKAGIPGIKYLDQQSRNAGGWHLTPPNQTVSGKWMVKSSDYNSKGMHFDSEAEAQKALQEKLGSETRNYVTFSDDIIKMVRKYGIGSLALLGVGGAAATRGEDSQ